MRYHDHHFHPFGYVSMVLGLELMGAGDLDSVLNALKARSEQMEGPVIGQRLNDEGLEERRLPTARDIDDVVPDRPVLLYRYCGHIAVANSEAMRLAGIDAQIADPPGGSFDRDGRGRPNGILRETAIPLVSEALEPLTREPSDDDILVALGKLPELGVASITGIVSVGGAVWCGFANEIATLARLAPDLPIDIDVLVIADTPAELASAKEKLQRADGRVRFLGYKAFIDGSLGGHTAAMYEPYADRPDTRGTERFGHARTVEMGRASLDLGGVVAIHAIGDRGNELVLDVLSGVNAFAFVGDLPGAEEVIRLADRLRQLADSATAAPVAASGDGRVWQSGRLAALYAAVGAPPEELRELWRRVSRIAAGAEGPERPRLALAGAAAAQGLLVGDAADPSALAELEAITGRPVPAEFQALAAVLRGDRATARSVLAQVADPEKRGALPASAAFAMGDPRPVVAETHFRLGNFGETLDQLEGFEPDAFDSRGFDPRWGLVARVRLLRGLALEKLGRLTEAGGQYQLVLGQWEGADSRLRPVVEEARAGLARIRGARG